MPIYEYICNHCSHAFEAIVHRTDDARCPQCDSATLTRELSVFAVGSAAAPASRTAPLAPCGTCGDVRGPGACSLN